MTIGRRGFFAAFVAALGLNRLRRAPAKPVLQACWAGGKEYADVAIHPEDTIYMGSFVSIYDPVTDKMVNQVRYRLYTCPRTS